MFVRRAPSSETFIIPAYRPSKSFRQAEWHVLPQWMEQLAPASTDLEGWRCAVREGRHVRVRLELIVAAIQDLTPTADRTVLNPLTQHLSESLQRILRRSIDVRHPNRGRDIIEATHAKIIEAVLRPDTPDGRSLRVAFFSRVSFRMRTSIALSARAIIKQSATPLDDVPAPPDPPIHESIDVETVLADVTDERKRLAFRLFMDGVPYTSKRPPSIVHSLGVCENTARAWIRSVRELLAVHPAFQEMRIAEKEKQA